MLHVSQAGMQQVLPIPGTHRYINTVATRCPPFWMLRASWK